MIEELEKIQLFQDLSGQQLRDVSRYCELLTLNDGEMLIHEASREDHDLYLLVQGSVEIVSAGTPVTSEEVVISNRDKELFGEIAWLAEQARTASVRCRGQVLAIRVDGASLNKYMEQNPDAGYSIMRNVAQVLARRVAGADTLLKQILWNTLL